MIKKISYFEKQLCQKFATFTEKKLLCLSSLFLLGFGMLIIYKAAVDYGFVWDQTEHLHAAYLVSIGQVPYKDFFEHHHPLLWYLLAPAMQWFYPSIKVVYFARFLALGFFAGCLWLLFVITDKFLFNRRSAVFTLLCLMSVPELWNDIFNLRPDILMLLSVLGGSAFFFVYLRNQSVIYLILSYILQIVAFLFLQKAALTILGFGIANLWLLLQKKCSWRDFIIAFAIALIPLLSFFGWIDHENIWSEYWWYNYLLNSLIPFFYNGYCDAPQTTVCFLWFGICGVGYFFYKKHGKLNNFSLVWLWCTITTLGATISFMPHAQYLYPIFIFMAPYWGNLVADIFITSRKYIVLMLCIILSMWALIPSPVARQAMQKYVNMMSFIIENFSPTEEVAVLSFPPSNIYQPDAHYYWFGFKDVAEIDVLFNPANKDFDFNQLIMAKKPRYILYSWFPQTAERESFHWFAGRNFMILQRIKRDPSAKRRFLTVMMPPVPSFWPVDDKYLRNNYENIKETHIWRRKDVAPQ